MDNPTKIHPISYYVFAGLQQMISENFDVKAPVFSSSENVEDLVRTSIKHEYPFAYLLITTMSPSGKSSDGKSRNGHAMARTGIMSRFNTDHSEALVTSIIPVTYEMEFHYATDNFNSLINFYTRWTFASVKNRLDFQLGYMELNYDIGIEIDPVLTVPTREGSFVSPSLFEFVGNLSVRGYIINDDPRDIRHSPLIKHVNLRLQTL